MGELVDLAAERRRRRPRPTFLTPPRWREVLANTPSFNHRFYGLAQDAAVSKGESFSFNLHLNGS